MAFVSIHRSKFGAGRAVLAVLLASVMSLACSPQPPSGAAKQTLSAEDLTLQHKFRGIHGIVTRLDAATSCYGDSIVDGSGVIIDEPSHLSPKNVFNSAYGGYGFPVPKAIRATWREGDQRWPRLFGQ